MTVAFVILLVVGFGSAVGLGSSEEEEAALGLGVLLLTPLLFAAIGVVYEVTMIATRGQTLGKMATSIRVVAADGGQLPGWGKSIGRWIIPIILVFVPFVGWLLSLLVYISLLWDKVRQGWHDKAAGTLVIKV